MLTDTDLVLADGRTLRVHDTGGDTGADDDRDQLVVFWHHGSPNTGEPPEPLLPESERLGVRWVSFDRPGYGASTPTPGRSVGSVADDVARVADSLGVERFAVMGHSGGAPHALACATLLPDRVLAAVCLSGLAPFGSPGLDWFAGISAGGTAELQAATRGREALAHELAHGTPDPEMFTAADEAQLEGAWSWFMTVVNRADAGGPDGFLDDDLAAVAPWGCDPSQAVPPVLFVHGEQDRMVPSAHSAWLAERVPDAELWLRPDDGHISVMTSAQDALGWLVEKARR